jgi:hypothetical protein
MKNKSHGMGISLDQSKTIREPQKNKKNWQNRKTGLRITDLPAFSKK